MADPEGLRPLFLRVADRVVSPDSRLRLMPEVVIAAVRELMQGIAEADEETLRFCYDAIVARLEPAEETPLTSYVRELTTRGFPVDRRPWPVKIVDNA